MDRMKKLLCAFLAIVMVAGVCVIPTEARSDNDQVQAFQALIDNAENGATVTLTEDLLWADGEPVEIPSGKNIAIDLNGYKMESLEPYPIFRVMSGAEVTIISSVDTSIAKNTGMPEEYQEYYDAETMGLFEVQENAKLTIESGEYGAGDNFFTGNTKGETVLAGGFYNKVPEGTYTVKSGYEFVSANRNGVDVWTLSEPTPEPDSNVTIVEDKKTEEAVKQETQKVVADIVAGHVSSSVVEEKTAEKVAEAINNGESVTAEIVVKEMKQEEIAQNDKIVIEDKVTSVLGEDAKVQYLDVAIVLKADDEELGTLNKLEGEITITVAIPEELKAEGRIYKVIRNHNGEVTVLDTVVNEDGTISFKTDRFSTYALAYADEEGTDTTPAPENKPSKDSDKPSTNDNKNIVAPKTGDNNSVMIYVGICLVALLASVATKKRIFEKF